MKLEASLLRPFIDITGNADFCVTPNAKVSIQELDVKVPPLNMHADITVPQIPIYASIDTWVLGLHTVTAIVNGTFGGFTVSVTGGTDEITIVTHTPPKLPITIDGCLQGVTRLNPKRLQLPSGDCCKGYAVPEPCSCEVHKSHAYCSPECKCEGSSAMHESQNDDK